MPAIDQSRFSAIRNLSYTLLKTLTAHPDKAVPHSNERKNEVWNLPEVQKKVRALMGHVGEQETVVLFSQLFDVSAKMVAEREGIIPKTDSLGFTEHAVGEEPEIDIAILTPEEVTAADLNLDLSQVDAEEDWEGINMAPPACGYFGL